MLSLDPGSSPGASTKTRKCQYLLVLAEFIDRFGYYKANQAMSVRKKNLPTGEGSVQTIVIAQYHDGDLSKYWYVHWREGGKTRKKYGKLAHISDLADRRAALEALRLEWQIKLDSSVIDPIIKMLREYLLAQKLERPWRWKTWQTNNSKVTVLETWLDGRKVTKELLTEFYVAARAKYHPLTFNRYIQELGSYFNGIGQMQIFPEVQRIKKAKKMSKPAQWLKKSELGNLQTAIDAALPVLWLAVRIMYNLALRQGELRLMKAENFYLDEAVAKVPAEISKTGMERWVKIPAILRPDIEFIRELAPNEYVFKSTVKSRRAEGLPVGKNYFTRKIREIMNQQGFDEKYKPTYSFRYTMAMRGLKYDKVPVEQMQMQFGHHSLDQFIYYCRQFNVFDMNQFDELFTGI